MLIFLLLTGRQTLGPHGNDLLHGRREVGRGQVHVEEFGLCRRIPANRGQAHVRRNLFENNFIKGDVRVYRYRYCI
jgi:hypothetical protein